MGGDIDLSVVGGPGLALRAASLQQALSAAGIRHEIVALHGDDGLAPAFLASRGRYVLSLGAQAEVAPQVVLELWRVRETAEVVVASRQGGRVAVPLPRRLLDRFLGRWLGLPLHDVSS